MKKSVREEDTEITVIETSISKSVENCDILNRFTRVVQNCNKKELGAQQTLMYMPLWWTD